MERNWLIRTSQNQILGPVAKEKLVEFIKKGALGLTDEVCSGNGYWFYLKEKELVDKYLFGDLPQSYNPISESKTVLAFRDNPNKTTSLNAGLANQQHAAPSLAAKENAIFPNQDDLDFPDMDSDSSSADITLVANIADLKLGPRASAEPKKNSELKEQAVVVSNEPVHLPDADDLEFPDVEQIVSKVKDTPLEVIESDESDVIFMGGSEEDLSFSLPDDYLKTKRNDGEDENHVQHFPSGDDLDFPDPEQTGTHLAKTSTKIEKGKVDLNHQYTRTVALDDKQIQDVFSENTPKAEPARVIMKKEKFPDERIQLHDRKVKTVPKGVSQRDPSRERAYKNADAKSEPLKRRNDSYLFYVLILLVLIIAAVFYYFKEILNKPLPV